MRRGGILLVAYGPPGTHHPACTICLSVWPPRATTPPAAQPSRLQAPRHPNASQAGAVYPADDRKLTAGRRPPEPASPSPSLPPPNNCILPGVHRESPRTLLHPPSTYEMTERVTGRDWCVTGVLLRVTGVRLVRDWCVTGAFLGVTGPMMLDDHRCLAPTTPPHPTPPPPPPSRPLAPHPSLVSCVFKTVVATAHLPHSATLPCPGCRWGGGGDAKDR